MDRRPMTLWEQLSSSTARVPDPAIRDLLKTPHDDEGEQRPCTLVDAIGRDRRGESGGGGVINRKPLRLRDRLRLRRAANASSTATSDRRADEDGIEVEEESKDEAAAPAAASMSLMALLEQAEDQWDDDDEDDDEDGACDRAYKSGAVVFGDEDGEGREEDEEEMVRACCVCMVRHKGAAFIPCGHTFCRLCSRDLWLTGASCPLCNASIHDILHIF